ncbi:polysaccharide biosynthesis protein, partial [Chlorogloeopsis sp. ULAP02]
TGEEYEPTEHDKLLVVKNASRIIPDNLTITVEKLCKAAAINDTTLIFFLLEQLVPGYKPKYLETSTAASTSKNNFVVTVANNI